MLSGKKAIEAAGVTSKHAEAFQKVADDYGCVIMSRSVNLDCTTLIDEGYASKGFFVKAKSCNWGPMAGFILADPRFSKQGADTEAVDKQKKYLKEAFEKNARSTPLYLSANRLEYLTKSGKLLAKNSNEEISFEKVKTLAQFDCDGITQYKSQGKDCEFRVHFSLVKDTSNNSTKNLWAVMYTAGETAVQWDKNKKDWQESKSEAGKLIAVQAMVNPNLGAGKPHEGEHKDSFPEYKRAITGDYDLFAVLSFDAKKLSKEAPQALGKLQKDGFLLYEHDELDMRPADIGGVKGERQDLGNITARLAIIRHDLNAEMQARDGYKGRDMVHHSDEAGRPFEPELEFPVIAFVPKLYADLFPKDFEGLNNLLKATEQKDKPLIYTLEKAEDLRGFFDILGRKYAVMVNTSWVKALEGLKGFVIPQWSQPNAGQAGSRGDYFRLNFGEQQTTAK